MVAFTLATWTHSISDWASDGAFTAAFLAIELHLLKVVQHFAELDRFGRQLALFAAIDRSRRRHLRVSASDDTFTTRIGGARLHVHLSLIGSWARLASTALVSVDLLSHRDFAVQFARLSSQNGERRAETALPRRTLLLIGWLIAPLVDGGAFGHQRFPFGRL